MDDAFDLPNDEDAAPGGGEPGAGAGSGTNNPD